MKVVVHMAAGVHEWTESNLASHRRFLKVEKKNLQEVILNRTGVKWDFADSMGNCGNTTTGNVERKLLHNEENRKLITDQISCEQDRN